MNNQSRARNLGSLKNFKLEVVDSEGEDIHNLEDQVYVMESNRGGYINQPHPKSKLVAKRLSMRQYKQIENNHLNQFEKRHTSHQVLPNTGRVGIKKPLRVGGLKDSISTHSLKCLNDEAVSSYDILN